MNRLWQQINELSDCVNRGIVKVCDLLQELYSYGFVTEELQETRICTGRPTMADVERAKKEAIRQAVIICWAIVFHSFRHRWGWGVIRMSRLWRQINDLRDSVTRGYVSIPDLMRELKEYEFMLEVKK